MFISNLPPLMGVHWCVLRCPCSYNNVGVPDRTEVIDNGHYTLYNKHAVKSTVSYESYQIARYLMLSINTIRS